MTDPINGIIVASAATRAEAVRLAHVIHETHPCWTLRVTNGGARWESKGGRWVVLSLPEAR